MHTNTTRIAAGLSAAFLIAIASACGSSAKNGVAGAHTTMSPTTLVGAGSTLVAPLLTKWQGDYSSAYDVTITYGAIGSGGGIEAITDRTVDFGASDAPLTSDQAKSCNGCVQIPWALAATTVSYNLPDITKPLRLTGTVIARIYLGSIKKWNDPAIAGLNRGVNLPSTSITVVYRSDGSGDTYAFTDYLSHVSSAWKTKVGGANTAVSWPTGIGAAHNSGVAAAIQATAGAIGYVGIGQAIGSSLHYASVENTAGQFVKPSTSSIAAAGATAHFASDNSASIVNPPASASGAYPISTFTYVIVRRSSSKLAALQKFIDYAATKGQQDATAYDFAPLPQSVAAKDKAIVGRL